MPKNAGSAYWSPSEFIAWRTRCGLTWKQAASALGVDRATIYRYDHGRSPVPKNIALACLAVEAMGEIPPHDSPDARATITKT